MSLSGSEELKIRARNGGCLHGEAYCQMLYKCEACSQSEMLWNSRDGVTPFIIGCRHCGKSARHVNFQQDRRVRDYQPSPGTRMFVDLSHADAYVWAQKQYEAMLVSEYRRDDMTKEQFIHAALKSIYSGSPHIVTVPAVAEKPREGVEVQ